MRCVPLLALAAVALLPAPAFAQVADFGCTLGTLQANSQQISAAKHVKIVDCFAAAGTIPDDSAVDAARENKEFMKELDGVPRSDILGVTSSGDTLTVYVNNR